MTGSVNNNFHPTSVPTYYTALGPFAGWFCHGLPILTYHKVGPRPWGARLRGLYASQRFLERQLRELRQAGYQSISLHAIPSDSSVFGASIILTFDDGFRK